MKQTMNLFFSKQDPREIKPGCVLFLKEKQSYIFLAKINQRTDRITDYSPALVTNVEITSYFREKQIKITVLVNGQFKRFRWQGPVPAPTKLLFAVDSYWFRAMFDPTRMIADDT